MIGFINGVITSIECVENMFHFYGWMNAFGKSVRSISVQYYLKLDHHSSSTVNHKILNDILRMVHMLAYFSSLNGSNKAVVCNDGTCVVTCINSWIWLILTRDFIGRGTKNIEKYSARKFIVYSPFHHINEVERFLRQASS